MDWATAGIDMSMKKYAGEECINYVNQTWRRIETGIILTATVYMFSWGFLKCKLPTIAYSDKDRSGRRLLLVVMCLTWGMEIGFKCASKTLIYLLNPCHITTVMQIYLLTAKPSKAVTTVFRMHLNYLNGPLLALIFYETETRMLPFEAAVYWIQHGLMLIVPYYLLRIGGVYNVEQTTDIRWSVLAYSIWVFYHFTVLQGVSLLTSVNMNHIMCPLDSDPFKGQFYRTAVFVHEGILGPLINKMYILASTFFLTRFEYTKVKDRLEYDIDSIRSEKSRLK